MHESPKLLDVMDLNEMVVFARVASRGSFAAAAKDLGVPPSTLSRKVASLERRLRVVLLLRTTRTLSLTEVGRAYYERCAALAEQAELADQVVMQLTHAPRGTLRITAPPIFSRSLLVPTVLEYLKHHSNVRVDLTTEDRTVDLLREEYDLAFRVASTLPATSMIARKLASTSHVLCASPRYLAQHPALRKPSDLSEHVVFAFGRDKKTVSWQFVQKRRTVERVKLTPKVLTSNEHVLLSFCLSGFGVALLPPGLAESDIAEGRLQRLLDVYDIEPRNVYMIMPQGKQMSPLVRPYVQIVEAFVRNSPRFFAG
jgi:DNA-binding transcriptional LysR family regulator